MIIEIIVTILILILLGFLATLDIAFTQLSDVSLRRVSSDGADSKNIFLREVLENRPRFRFAVSATSQILLIIFATLIVRIIDYFVEYSFEAFVIALISSLTLAFFFRQFLPQLITLRNPEDKVLFLLPFIRPIYGLMAFLSDPLHFFSKSDQLDVTVLPHKKEDDHEDDSEDFQALIRVGEAEGIIEEEDRELIESVFEFTETKVAEIMTPRTEICAIEISETINSARDLIIEEKYSRLPVFRDRIENIEGVIYVRDLLQAWSDGNENQKIETLMRPAFFIPETKSAADLLKSMQQNHVQIAIVVDEYGGVAGLITVEDIIEELVGEIEDEDTGHQEVIEIIEGGNGTGETYFDVLGSTEIHKIERIFANEIEDDDYTTIAGLVTSELGFVPKEGEKFNIRGLDIEVLKADDKRLQLLRLRKAPENENTVYEANQH